MLLVTLPHSGEKIPEPCFWLKNLPNEVLLRDVDRFVDQLYQPVLDRLKISYVKTEWHRYAADLNREPKDVDQDSVEGAMLPSGSMPRGFHWVKTTYGEQLMPRPLTQEEHQFLVNLVYEPFHRQIQSIVSQVSQLHEHIWHLDLHSMPSVGTSQHRDPGQLRADIVISDQHGRSADKKFVDLIITAYVRSGFKVGYNWPYYGGKITELYGNPSRKHHTVQVELNRSLYMNEETKQKNEHFVATQKKIESAITFIKNEIEQWSVT
jgi:N-formylglutamate amidohydrolase